MSDTTDSVKLNVKNPKKVLYFSDGILEDFDDEVDGRQNDSNTFDSGKQLISKKWPMTSTVVNSMFWFGSQTLRVCDYIGEYLADFFGITSPKYEYEIDEYNRRIEEQNRRQSMLRSEFEGWNQSDSSQSEAEVNDVKSVHK